MQKQICTGRLFKRRVKSSNQRVRKIADETDSIRQHDLSEISQIELTRRGVQRREKLVSCITASLGQCIEERGLAGIRVTHERNDRR
jgi:hypothetical protein